MDPEGAPPIAAPGPKRRRWILPAAIVSGLVALAVAGAYAHTHGWGRAPRHTVAVYFTDLPGDLEEVRFGLLDVSVGEEGWSLELEVSEVIITRHVGTSDGLLIAAGEVPDGTDDAIRVRFDYVEGLREDRWERVEMASDTLWVYGALSDTQRDPAAALMDFDLAASLEDSSAGVTFTPRLAQVYGFSAASADVRDAEMVLARVRPAPDARVAAEADPSRDPEERTSDSSRAAASDGPGPTRRTSATPTQSRAATTSSRSISPTGAVNAAPDLPALPGPADGDRYLPGDEITLTWTGGDPDGEAVTYKVHVDNALRCSGAEPECTISPLEPGRTYAWRVEARDARGLERVGRTWTFSTNALPAKPPLSSPANGSQTVDLSPTFQWTAAADADAGPSPVTYDVRLRRDGESAWNHRCLDVATTSCSSGSTLLPGVWYYWQVVASDGGLDFSYSEEWKFKTKVQV